MSRRSKVPIGARWIKKRIRHNNNESLHVPDLKENAAKFFKTIFRAKHAGHQVLSYVVCEQRRIKKERRSDKQEARTRSNGPAITSQRTPIFDDLQIYKSKTCRFIFSSCIIVVFIVGWLGYPCIVFSVSKQEQHKRKAPTQQELGVWVCVCEGKDLYETKPEAPPCPFFSSFFFLFVLGACVVVFSFVLFCRCCGLRRRRGVATSSQ